jgi:hypothetical protein
MSGCSLASPKPAIEQSAARPGSIDRHALVTRHNPVIRELDVDATLTVGNGGFAFGADITGLQTFADHYHQWGVPTETLSRWCWVSDPNTNGYTLADASRDYVQADGRVVPYATESSTPAGQWLRKNPRNQPLGQLGLVCNQADGSPLQPDDIEDPQQTLDLWRGILTSHYRIDGVPVDVVTACHPDSDTVAVRLSSDLVAEGRLRVRFAFPRGYDPETKNTPALDWSHPESHTTRVSRRMSNGVRLSRNVQSTLYGVDVAWEGHAALRETGAHQYELSAEGGSHSIAFTIRFHPSVDSPWRCPTVEQTLSASADHWAAFWQRGAAVDFTGSTDPRARQLEERIVLSRYLMAAQMAGDVPPQESGLTCSTWYGKHHTEMIWWHAAHFPLWGDDALLETNLAWYQAQLPEARALAERRGLKGARWAKMVGPVMRESPGGNPLIVWNQPHLVYLCELLYRNHPTAETLEKYRDLVLETAECLASMVYFDEDTGVYVLGPPLWIAQEIYDQATSQNPSFELAYWEWALETAQQWRTRLGMARDPHWDHVIQHLTPVPQKDGKYVALGSHPDTWENIESRHDHPTMLAPLGVLPGTGVERGTMERTLDAVLASWDWETKIWGWDYPMIAMTATRLGRPETAVDVLLRNGPNNVYLPNGHCPQRSDETMPLHPPPGARKREIAVYLPANGAFLSAVALMTAGWDGCEEEFPGFPKDGRWTIHAEGLRPLP